MPKPLQKEKELLLGHQIVANALSETLREELLFPNELQKRCLKILVEDLPWVFFPQHDTQEEVKLLVVLVQAYAFGQVQP